MDLVVEDGTAVEDANTYASLSHAGAYYSDREAFASQEAHPWFAMTADRRKVLLFEATTWIEATYTWPGAVISSRQGLSLPRHRLVTRAGLFLEAAEQVRRAADAVSYLALQLSLASTVTELDENIQSWRLRDYSVTYGAGGRQVRYPEVDRILAGMYLTGGFGSGTRQLMRA